MTTKKYPRHNSLDGYIDFRAWKKGEIFKELYKLKYDPRDFIEQFQTSPIADEGDADLLSNYVDQSSRAVALTFAIDLLEKHNIRLKDMLPDEKIPTLYTTVGKLDPDAIAWIGMIYEMLACYLGVSGKEVYNRIGFEEMYLLWEDAEGNEPYFTVKEIARVIFPLQDSEQI